MNDLDGLTPEDIEIIKQFFDIVVRYKNELPPDMIAELELLMIEAP